jgi:hypothetical protein
MTIHDNINATIQANGDLLLTAGNATRAEIAELQRRNDRTSLDILTELTETYWTNGSYQPFDAGDGDPFVGLTSAPCIAECLDTHDSGENEIVGRLWWFPNYMLRDPCEELKRTGRVLFTLAD